MAEVIFRGPSGPSPFLRALDVAGERFGTGFGEGFTREREMQQAEKRLEPLRGAVGDPMALQKAIQGMDPRQFAEMISSDQGWTEIQRMTTMTPPQQDLTEIERLQMAADRLRRSGQENRAVEIERRIEQLAPSPESKAAMTAAEEEAKLKARRDNIDAILNTPDTSGISIGLPENAFMGEAGSNDARRVSGLFSQAQKLFRAGETTLASNALSQASFLAQNSPEIQKSRELDKVIPESLASELQVPVGTTMREIVGLVPKSPAEKSRETAVAGALGRGEVGAKQQIGFINEATGTIESLLSEIEKDPGVVGIRGSLRSTGQTALGVLSDLGAKNLLGVARDIAASASDLPLDEFQTMFESETLSTLNLLENSIGLILARMRTPDGRIPVDVITRSIDDVSLSGITSSEQVKSRLNLVLNLMKGREANLRSQFGMEQPSNDVPPELWEVMTPEERALWQN